MSVLEKASGAGHGGRVDCVGGREREQSGSSAAQLGFRVWVVNQHSCSVTL